MNKEVNQTANGHEKETQKPGNKAMQFAFYEA